MYGLHVSTMSFRETVRWLVDRAEAGSRTNVAALNAGKVVGMRHDPELRRAMEAADLVLPDGSPVVWAGRLFGRRIPQRVTGVDVMDATMSEAERRGLAVFFLGARPEVLARAVQAVRARHPGLKIAGSHDGYFSEEDDAEVVGILRRSGAHLCYLGISTPKKERWVARRIGDIGIPVVMGVGGSLDIMAGITTRAPRWMQRLGLEWLYRLILEPKRMWRRYLFGNPEFLAITLRETVRCRGDRNQPHG